jgi:hypothetical protein
VPAVSLTESFLGKVILKPNSEADADAADFIKKVAKNIEKKYSCSFTNVVIE